MTFLVDVEIRGVLFVILAMSAVWLGMSLLFQTLLLVKGSSREVRFVPRVVRVALVSLTAMVSTPKVATAAPHAGVTTSLPVSEGSDWMPIALTGSAASNALALAALVRRKLVRMRSEKFGRHETSPKWEEHPERTEFINPSESWNPDWKILVRVLGPPLVETRSGTRVCFGKGKAQELIVWMTEHRQASTRSGARTALWDEAVQDSTFSNVVSEARRALSTAVALDDEEWIPRTFTDELPLHRAVITDAELLDMWLKRFSMDRDNHWAELKSALDSVANLPFWGANYPWADGEGITTSHVMKVVKSAVLLGEYAIENDDIDLLFGATERGLRVLPGHEELVALRMKGHARVGNRSAIKHEWESYARAVEADSWAGAVPSPALRSLAESLSVSWGCQDDIKSVS